MRKGPKGKKRVAGAPPRKGSVLVSLWRSPLVGAELDLRRPRETGRKVDLGDVAEQKTRSPSRPSREQARQIKEIKRGLAAADAGDFATDAEVNAVFTRPRHRRRCAR